MSQNDTLLQGKRLSFVQLFIENNYNIEIPIIQRDYAQGRKSTFEVRELFLQALHDYLEDDIPNRDLDFVYGSTEIDGKIEKFIPLDGQQRLTTLFLLHWYLAVASKNIEEFKEVITHKNKSRFSYLTRTSSSEFCDALLENTIDLINLLKPDKGVKNSLSKTIKDCGWYFLSWSYDPTIQSMLVMLDAIHDKFQNKEYFYDRLINIEKPIITFLYLDLGEFKLTEDLYIKMNSRGKTLTSYENFKAKFEQHIAGSKLNLDKQYQLSFKDKLTDVTPKEYFSFKIDTAWANLFWQYRELKGDIHTFDDELMNFIRTIMLSQFAIDTANNSSEVLEYLIGTSAAKKRDDYSDTISFYKYKNFDVLSGKAIKYLIDAFDALENGNDKIKEHLGDNFYFNEAKNFEDVLQFNLKLPQIVQFHAYLRFLILNKDDLSGLFQWMRVIFNLTENTNFDKAEDVGTAIKSIEKIVPFSNDIVKFLTSNDNKIDFFLGRQVQEEKIKAHLILKSDLWKQEIESAEQHKYFAGQIAFMFEFAGILEYYEKMENCNWAEQDDNKYLTEFVNYKNKSLSLFNLLHTDKNSDFKLERAVLTKGDYLINSYSRYNFLSTNKNLRDYSWKRLLRLPPVNSKEEEKNHWKAKRNYVKELFDDVKFNTTDVEKALSSIVKAVPKDWRKHFITNEDLITYCSQGYIDFKSDEEIYLLMHSQRNHRHREMFTYNLYLKYIEPELQHFTPFRFVTHMEIKSTDDISGIHLYDWPYKRKQYQFEIYKSHDSNKYFIVFNKSKGDKKQSDYDTSIGEILENHKLTWDPKFNFYSYALSNEIKVVELLKSVCKELTNLVSE
ncbi:hypothetical protein B0A79_22635 [Flavobacterium piscis]|uniref:GmrSD restriction endonucleases N-terminal domain-containing protein n=1 Tax=Flavobacterium piscis TaxID=1114874 RepID=A0ABX2XFK1_9FLAO|nr:DUF262 domain-containing protein [Flavobacterium piscis]OCB71194.1 hypothetical protein FLP_16920 [Flavobacterium piscis]OXE96632.1 hypothetical protein B0A79_22635 [Flavobacterium piscis]